MNSPAATDGRTRPAPRIGWRLLAPLIVAALIIVIAAANAHLVYVAFESEPGCVPHASEAGAPGTFMAAKSAC